MIYIVGDDNKSNFDAAIKYGDSNSASDILTDRISKLLSAKRNEVIAVLKENGIEPGNTTESITNALATGFKKSEKIRKSIAMLIAINEAKAYSNMTSEEAKLVSAQLNKPEIQNQLKNIATSIFNLFAKEDAEKITKEVVEKTNAQNQPAAQKNYTGYYVAGGIVLTGAVLIGCYYAFVKPGKNASE